MPQDTPDTNTTPGEGGVQDRCTLTAEEQEAIEWCIFQQATPQRTAVTLRRLLERFA